jgi:hypothetical protein
MPKPIVIMKKWDKIMFKDCGKCIAMEQSGYIIKWEKNGENKK